MQAKALVFAIIGLFMVATVATAEVPHMINYQGSLTDDNGVAINDTATMKFEIYANSTGGSPLWQETRICSVRAGLFSVVLGEGTSIDYSVFDGSVRWLQVIVRGESLSPRKKMVSVGYAFTDGDWVISGSNVYRLTGNVGIGTSSPSEKLDIVGGNIQLSDDRWIGISSSAERIAFDSNGNNIEMMGANVGIGTTSPAEKLDVDGNANVSVDLDVGDDVTVGDDLTVNGTLKLTFDYNSGWELITKGTCETMTHGLLGDPDKYIVFLDGKSTNGYIHQKNYGTNCLYQVVGGNKWQGCEWDRLTSTTIRVCRGDNDDVQEPDDDWKYFRIRILKNQ